ncbi:MAG: hypothetical protein JST19_20355 [Bacteroidetes bacterium]|nr:hypothetical protein [Bacteroidota bacterium]
MPLILYKEYDEIWFLAIFFIIIIPIDIIRSINKARELIAEVLKTDD